MKIGDIDEKTYITFAKEIYYRLPYKLFVYYNKCDEPIMRVKCISESTGRLCLISNNFYLTEIEPNEVKLILRPMRSMTKEERSEYRTIAPGLVIIDGINIPNFNKIEWLIQRHFDFRDWIGQRLGVPVTEEFDPYKNPFEEYEEG